MSEKNTGLAVVQQSGAIEPSTMPELEKLAKYVVDSRFFGVENVAQATMLMLRGKDLGFSYAQACSAFHNIKGKLTLTADAMVAVCLQRRDLCSRFRPVEQTETRATWEAQRVGDEPVRLTFTIEEARTAGLTEQNGSMWKKYPKRMLSARCKAFLARDLFPELLLGLLSTEEAQDIADEPRAPVVRVADRRKTIDRDKCPTADHDADHDADDPAVALLSAITNAEDQRALDAVGREIAKQKASLAERDVDALKQAFAKRKRELAAEASRQSDVIDATIESPAPPAVEEVGEP